MTTAGHVTHQPVAVLKSGSVNRQLQLAVLRATRCKTVKTSI